MDATQFELRSGRDRERARHELPRSNVAAIQEECEAGQLGVAGCGSGRHERRIPAIELPSRRQAGARPRDRKLRVLNHLRVSPVLRVEVGGSLE